MNMLFVTLFLLFFYNTDTGYISLTQTSNKASFLKMFANLDISEASFVLVSYSPNCKECSDAATLFLETTSTQYSVAEDAITDTHDYLLYFWDGWSTNFPIPTSLLTKLLIISTTSRCQVREALQHAQNIVYFTILCLTPSRTIWRIYNANSLLDETRLNPKLIPTENFTNVEVFSKTKLDMKGQILHVASDIIDEPLFFKDKQGNYEGLTLRIVHYLSTMYNFTYDLTDGASDGSWGEFINGTWTGLLGDVYSGEKDIAVNYFTVTRERAEYLDYSVPYFREGFGFALLPPRQKPQWTNIIMPFSPFVWLLVLLSYLAVATICSFYARTLKAVGEYYFKTYMILILQGLYKLPPYGGLRNFLFFWQVTSYIIVLSYSTSLISVLTIPFYPERIETVEELASSPYTIVMADYGEFVPQALKESTNRILWNLGQKLILTPYDITMEFSGYEISSGLVLQGSYVQIETISFLKFKYKSMGVYDKVYFMKEQVYEGNLALFYQKDFSLKEYFDVGITRLTEFGITQKWYKDIMEDLLGVNKGESQEHIAISLKHLQGAFVVVGLGFGLAFLSFCIEFFAGLQAKRQRFVARKI